ncbi:MAG: T9SS type A sorting domain-containing protein, partial [Candidatus Kapabacteria bacterium]|nr:T9SS type A sorting domain-containing protein [Candidatus Kapabacteria bacterium]
HYIKDATFSDDGYYFALVEHPNDSIFDYYCNPLSTDTIKVTVTSEGVVAGVKGNELNPGLIVTPNPTSDFITITELNNGLQPIVHKVQIFDVLGIEVMSELIHPMTSSHQMNVEKLRAGVYFIRVGTRVEKFVKM